MIEKRFWTMDDIQKRFNLSKRTVYRLTASGALPCVHIGGRPLKPMQFDPAVVEGVFTTPINRSLKTEKQGIEPSRRRPIPRREKLCL